MGCPGNAERPTGQKHGKAAGLKKPARVLWAGRRVHAQYFIKKINQNQTKSGILHEIFPVFVCFQYYISGNELHSGKIFRSLQKNLPKV
jgi:hypothetical protein